jgi:hypothetical protein
VPQKRLTSIARESALRLTFYRLELQHNTVEGNAPKYRGNLLEYEFNKQTQFKYE